MINRKIVEDKMVHVRMLTKVLLKNSKSYQYVQVRHALDSTGFKDKPATLESLKEAFEELSQQIKDMNLETSHK